MSARWAAGADVRVSDAVGMPVTFGSTILLPPECFEWSTGKRQAVLLHEGSHVAHGDFYVLLLAVLNRAVFWFSPLAWWQLARLADLAESSVTTPRSRLCEIDRAMPASFWTLQQCERAPAASPWRERVPCGGGSNASWPRPPFPREWGGGDGL